MENKNEYLIYPLVDEDGTSWDFVKLKPEVDYKGNHYVALVPYEEAENAKNSETEFCNYVVLRVEKDENNEDDWVSVEDDEEFDDVADLFDDLLSEEIDYDEA